MHRLVLVRHAEAGAAVVDATRPLTARGERDAAALGQWLAGRGLVPGRVVVSPARRTRQTWDRAAAALGAAPEGVEDERLYENTVDAVLDVVTGAAEDVGTLLVVGHAPSLPFTTAVLDAAGTRTGFPPGTAAVLDLGVPFAEAGPGAGSLADVRLPGG